MTRDSYLSRRGGSHGCLLESAPIWIGRASDGARAIFREWRLFQPHREGGAASRCERASVVIPCQKGVRLTYYRTNEVGGNFKRPCLSVLLSPCLARNQNHNGTEVGSGEGCEQRDCDRRKKGDVRDGRIFLGWRNFEEARKGAAVGKIRGLSTIN